MNYIYAPRIDGIINARNIKIGQGVIVEEGVLITGKSGQANTVVLGDFCFIGRETRIMVPAFRIGDYSKLHAFSYIHGDKPVQIGRNCWIGGNTVLDGMGGLDIDDNVGIGSHSQIWTHIQFGDIIEGCRFFSKKYMHIGKDAWFVGHCIVSPVKVGEKSMALVGSVITKDMYPNHVYAGVPAKDVSDQLGFQFSESTLEEKEARLSSIINDFFREYPKHQGQLMVVKSDSEIIQGKSCFNIANRTYTKTYSKAEVEFLKTYVPLIKFIPVSEPSFVTPQK